MMSVCLPPVFNHFDIESMELNLYNVLDRYKSGTTLHSCCILLHLQVHSFLEKHKSPGFTPSWLYFTKCQQVNTFLVRVFNNKWKLRSKGVKLAIHETLVVDLQKSDWRKYILTTAEKTKKNLDTEKHQIS